MNQQKIGAFIKQLRAEENLTQRELAEAISVSEKTVSKWETGKGMPDVSLMLPLCERLKITVNELLSGERLSRGEQYEKHAEQNIIALAGKRIRAKTKLIVCIISIAMSVLALVGMAIFMEYLELPEWKKVLLLSFSLLQLFALIALLSAIALSTESFECVYCKKLFVPKPSAYIMGVHTLTRRYLKCPHCGKRGWQKCRYLDFDEVETK